MAEWKTISSENDIADMMNICAHFHDCCIVSAQYESGAFVDKKRNMHFGQAYDRTFMMVLHSQLFPERIELCFSGVRQVHLTGWQERYECNISSAHLSFYDDLLPGPKNKVIVWADTDCFDLSKIDNSIHEPSDTYIVADALKWRIIE